MITSNPLRLITKIFIIYLIIIFLYGFITPVYAQTSATIFSDDFENNLTQWTKSGFNLNYINTTTNNSFGGVHSLRLNYQPNENPPEANLLVLSKDITPTTNVLVRVYFYDHLTEQAGAFISIEDNTNFISIGTKPKETGLESNYYIRSNQNWHDTEVTRSQGWHLFEFITTPTGTYTKIDNIFHQINDTLITQVSRVKLAATWQRYGIATFDNFLISTKDTRPWQDQSKEIIQQYYKIYSQTNFEPVKNTTNNYTRSLLNTANTFYTYFKISQIEDAKTKAIDLYQAAINHPAWNNPSDWELGNQLTVLATTTSNLWSDLSASQKSQAQTLIDQLAQTYLTASSLRLKNYNTGSSIATYNINHPQSSNRSTRIMFYDDMNPAKRTFVGVYTTDESQYSLVGVNDNSSEYYVRYKSEPNDIVINSSIPRSAGWHNFKFITDPNAGTATHIDEVGIVLNTQQRSTNILKLAAPYVSTTTAHYDHLFIQENGFEYYQNFNQPLTNWQFTTTGPGEVSLDPAINFLSFPKSKHIYDTKAEDNAWNASGLASAANLFNISNSNQLLDRARCMAFHSITTSTDNTFCGYTTQTVYDDFRLDNHGRDNPVYSIAVLSLLAQAAQSYQAKNLTVPSQFTHNYHQLLQAAYNRTDSDTLIFPALIPDPDWHSAADTFDRAVLPLAFLESINQPFASVSVQKLFEVRSLTYKDIVSHWQARNPEVIYDQGHISDPQSDGFNWLLNSHYAGSILSPVLNNYVLSPIPTHSPTPTTFPFGDINQDTLVNQTDYNLLLAAMNKTGTNPADLNLDRKVNIFDLSELIHVLP